MDDGGGDLFPKRIANGIEIQQIKLRAGQPVRSPSGSELWGALDEVMANQSTGAGDPDNWF
jgi:hypothetical protein